MQYKWAKLLGEAIRSQSSQLFSVLLCKSEIKGTLSSMCVCGRGIYKNVYLGSANNIFTDQVKLIQIT